MGGKEVGGLLGHFDHVAEAEENNAASVAEDFTLSDFKDLRMLLRLGSCAGAARVTDGDGTLMVVGHGPKHVGEFFFVLGLHEDEVRDVAEVADVEESVMRRPVVAAQSGAVHAEGDVQILQGNVMDDHVISPLHERAVDGEKRFVALGGESAGEEGGMFLGNAHVVVAVRVSLFENAQTGAAGHGRGDGDDAVVVVGEVGEFRAEKLRVGGRGGRLGFAGVGFEFAQTVEFVRLLHGRRISFAFRGEDVEKDGLVLRLEEFESALEEVGIVSVDRPVISEPQVFEDHAGQEHVLHACLDLVGEIEGALPADRLDEFGGLLVEVGVGGIGRDLAEVAGHGADVSRDRPFVVVENDDEAFGCLGGIIERFEADATGEGRVAGHDDNMFVGSAQVAGRGHAEPGGEGGAGVPRAVTVVFALGAEEEAVQSAVLTDGIDLLAATGEHFVHVGLMADVEEDFVLGRIEGAVQGDGQFDHAEVRSEVSAGFRDGPDEFVADFLREQRQVLLRHGAEIGRAVDPFEDGRSMFLRHHRNFPESHCRRLFGR